MISFLIIVILTYAVTISLEVSKKGKKMVNKIGATEENTSKQERDGGEQSSDCRSEWSCTTVNSTSVSGAQAHGVLADGAEPNGGEPGGGKLGDQEMPKLFRKKTLTSMMECGLLKNYIRR